MHRPTLKQTLTSCALAVGILPGAGHFQRHRWGLAWAWAWRKGGEQLLFRCLFLQKDLSGGRLEEMEVAGRHLPVCGSEERKPWSAGVSKRMGGKHRTEGTTTKLAAAQSVISVGVQSSASFDKRTSESVLDRTSTRGAYVLCYVSLLLYARLREPRCNMRILLRLYLLFLLWAGADARQPAEVFTPPPEHLHFGARCSA